MSWERLQLPVEAPRVEHVSVLFGEAEGEARERPLLLANGAGFHMESPWMASVAEGLRARGFTVMRFNYPYKERSLAENKPLPPNRAPILEAAHARALDLLRERTGCERPLLAGKSLGARMSTHLAAQGHAAAGLVLFGFPLHAPKRTERLRSEHFAAIAQPALFLQGTRDSLCDLGLLEPALATWGGKATVEVIEDADHGFHVPKRSGTTDAEVLERVLDRVARWDSETFPV
jgi:predicted alpha/beta-hydrolase family hydrolase